MYLRNLRQNARPVSETRHFRLFELMRQSNVYAGIESKPHASESEAIETFRDMACASLRF